MWPSGLGICISLRRNLINLKMEEYFGKPHIQLVRFLSNHSHQKTEIELRTVGQLGCPELKCRHIRSVRFLSNLSHWKTEIELRTVGWLDCPEPICQLCSAPLEIGLDQLKTARLGKKGRKCQFYLVIWAKQTDKKSK